MRRLLLVVTVALVMAAMVVVTAAPALAVANDSASCRGQGLSIIAPGNGVGQGTSLTARQRHGIGDLISNDARRDNTQCFEAGN